MSAPCPLFGFRVRLRVPEVLAGEISEAMDALLAARGLLASASRRGTVLTWTVSSEAGQATEDDRDAVLEWARQRRELAEIDVGPLGDLRDMD